MNVDSSTTVLVGSIEATAVTIGRAGFSTSLDSATNIIAGTAQFSDSGDGNSVSLVGPSTQTASVTYTLPTAPTSSGLVLTSTPGGTMTWTTNGSSITLAAVGASPNADAASLTGGVLNLQPANASFPGVVTTGAQSLAGTKTFSAPVTLLDTGDANVVALQAPSTQTASVTYTLPTAPSTSGQVLTSTTGGVMSWNATGGLSLAAVGASPNADAATLAAGTLTLQPANASFPGVVTTGAQSLAGTKTFSAPVTLLDTGDSNVVALQAPSTQTASVTYTLPTAPTSSGQVLASTTGGVMSWTAAGTALSLAAVGAAPNADAASLTGGVLNLQPANASFPGVVTTAAQSLAGTKTFSSPVTLLDTGDSNVVALQAPSTQTASTTYTLPTAPSTSGQVLTSTTAGVMSWNATGGLSLAAVGASPNADAATLAAGTLTLQPANNTNPGVVTAGAQALGGTKTFSAPVTLLDTSDSNTVALQAPSTQTASVTYTLPTAPTANGMSLVSTTGGTMTWAANGNLSLAAVGSSPNADAATLASQVLTLQPANGTNPGVVTAAAQTLGGTKTFSSPVTLLDTGDANVVALQAPSTQTASTTYTLPTAPSTSGQVLTSTTAGVMSWNATGGLSLAAVGSSPNADAATLAAGVLTLQPANNTNPGVVTAGTQTLGGTKTFSAPVTLLDTGDGNTIALQAPSTQTASTTYTLPTAPSTSGQVLTSTTAGVMSWNATGGLSLAPVGSSPNADAATLAAGVLTLQPANDSNPGVMTTGAQMFAGTKSFGSPITLVDTGDSNTVSLQAPSTQASSTAYTLPTAPTVVGLALTSTTGGAMSWATAGGTSPFRYIVSPTSQYTTIQSAVSAAQSQGASSTTPAIVYVTEGTYTGDITLTDGIYVTSLNVFGTNPGAGQTPGATLLAIPAPSQLVKLTGRIFVTQSSTSAVINCGLSGAMMSFDTASDYLFNFSSQTGSGNHGAQINFFLNNVGGVFSNVTLFGYTGNTDLTGSTIVSAFACTFSYTSSLPGTAQWFTLDSTCASHTFQLDALRCIFLLSTITNAYAFGTLTITLASSTVEQVWRTSGAASPLIAHSSAGIMTLLATDSTIASIPTLTSTTSQTLITHTGTGQCAITGIRSSIQIGDGTGGYAGFLGSLLSSTSAAAVSVTLTKCHNLPPANPMFSGNYFVNLSGNTSTGSFVVVADCAVQPYTGGAGTPYAGLDFAVGAALQQVQATHVSVPNPTASCPMVKMDVYIVSFVKQVRWSFTNTIETQTTTPTSLIFQVAGSQVLALPSSSMTVIEATVSAGNLLYTNVYAGKVLGAFQVNSTPAGALTSLNTNATTTSTASVALVSPFDSQSYYFDLQATAPSSASYLWSSNVTLTTTTSVGAS